MEKSGKTIYYETAGCGKINHVVRTNCIADLGFALPVLPSRRLSAADNDEQAAQSTMDARSGSDSDDNFGNSSDDDLGSADEVASRTRLTSEMLTPLAQRTMETVSGDCTGAPRTAAMGLKERLLESVLGNRARDEGDASDGFDHEGFIVAPRVAAMSFSEELLEAVRDDAARDDDSWVSSDHEGLEEDFAVIRSWACREKEGSRHENIRAPSTPALLRDVRGCYNPSERRQSSGQSTKEVQCVHHDIKRPAVLSKPARPFRGRMIARPAGSAPPPDVRCLADDCHTLEQKVVMISDPSHSASPMASSRPKLPPIGNAPRRGRSLRLSAGQSHAQKTFPVGVCVSPLEYALRI